MKNIYVDSGWNHHTDPCRRMARFTTSYWEYPTTLHDNDVGPKYKDKYFSLHLHFPHETFKQIVLVRSFDIQTLIGNAAGGYIGKFLGQTLLQIPGLVDYLWKKLKHLFKS